MARVRDKVAMVTGAASNPGLGFSTALTLAREGARLVVTDIDAAGAERCAEAIRMRGAKRSPSSTMSPTRRPGARSWPVRWRPTAGSTCW